MMYKCADIFPETIRIILIIVIMKAMLLTGCTDPRSKGDEAYLIRVGGSIITVPDFNKALEIAKTAYPHNSLQNPDATKAIQLRLLDQMTEEAIFLERARELDISVSDDEIEKEIAKFKGDYPDDVFEKTLLENAISYNSWKKRLKARLIIEKVVKNDLEEKITITPEEIKKYYEENYKNKNIKPDSVEDPEELIIKRLRRKKTEEAYNDWIKEIQKNYTVDINQEQWKKITGS